MMVPLIISCMLVMFTHAQPDNVVPDSYCNYACAPGQSCVTTGIRCFRAPCPTHQCSGAVTSDVTYSQGSRPSVMESLALLSEKLRTSPGSQAFSANTIAKPQQPRPSPNSKSIRVVPDSYCSGNPCEYGEECVDTGLRCMIAPCPGVYQCQRTETAQRAVSQYQQLQLQELQQQQQQAQQPQPQYASVVPMLSQFGPIDPQQQPEPVFVSGFAPVEQKPRVAVLPSKQKVVPFSYCDVECAQDESCVDTGIQCFMPPCPTYQCQPTQPDFIKPEVIPQEVIKPAPLTLSEKLLQLQRKSKSPSALSRPQRVYPNTYCEQGCAFDEVCVDSGIRCFRAPCPPVFQCQVDQSQGSTVTAKPNCTRRCDPSRGYYCAFRKSCMWGGQFCNDIQICQRSTFRG